MSFQSHRERDKRDVPASTAVAPFLDEARVAAFMRAFPRTASAGIGLLDTNWRFVYINEALARMNGFPPAEHIGRFVGDLLPEIWADAEPLFRQVRESRQPIDNIALEGETPAEPGIHRHWRESLFPVFGEDGEVLGVGTIVMETTQERRHEEALYQSEERFHVAQELSLDGFTIFRAMRDDNGAVIDFEWEYANPAAERILARGALKGRRITDVVPGVRDLPAGFPRYIRVMETGKPDKAELSYESDGIRRWFRSVAVRLDDGVAVSFADITASKIMEEDLRRANAVKDEVLGLVSHELRAPLTTVVGIANILERRLDSLDEPTLRELVTQLAGDARHLQVTIENMLLLARADAEATETEPILAHRLAEAFVAEHNQRHAERPVAIDIDPEGDLPPVCGRKTWFEHVLSNLVSNAVKYAPAGSEILVRVRRFEPGVAVEVCDRGPGLSPDEMSDVFKPFFRSARAKGQTSGAGLGLAVCRRLVELQGGHIYALPREDSGLIVRFVLPAMTEE